MGRMGVQIGPGQATRLLASYRGGDVAAMGEEIFDEGARKGAGGRLLGLAERKVKRGAGLTPAAAGLEARRIGVGMGAAKTVISLETASLNAATAINRLPLDKLAGAVERATKAIDVFLSGKGGAGFFGLMEDLVNALRGPPTGPRKTPR
jgi:hypothetical protein